MSYRILTYIGTALIIASCALFTGDRVYNSHLEHSYEKAVEDSVVYVPTGSGGENLEAVNMSGVVPSSMIASFFRKNPSKNRTCK